MNTRGIFESVKITDGIRMTLKLDDKTDLNSIDELINKDLDIEIKIHREKRSLDSNAYLWVLCDKIAQKINSTKIEVYRKAIREVGVFEVLPIKKEAVKRFIENWQHNGIGYLCESTGKSKLEGYENAFAYYGSSSYDSKEMSRLIDYIVEEAKELGIETLTPEQLKSMNESWGQYAQKNGNDGDKPRS